MQSGGAVFPHRPVSTSTAFSSSTVSQAQSVTTMYNEQEFSRSRFEGFSVGERALAPSEITRRLGPHLTDERRQRIRDVVRERTYHVVTVVEGLANTGNVSAVMRTAEGLGMQEFHVVRGSVPPKKSQRTTQGAHKWLDVHFHETVAACIEPLRDRGYRIAVTHLDANAVPISALDFSEPVAIVLGNELSGVSEDMITRADATILLPMTGFVQSYNVSVAAAMALYHADQARRAAGVGALSPEEQERLEADFTMRAVRHAERLLKL